MPTQEEVFDFLNDLRESGETNMYGARPYLVEEFDMDRREAGDWLQKWMKSFD